MHPHSQINDIFLRVFPDPLILHGSYLNHDGYDGSENAHFHQIVWDPPDPSTIPQLGPIGKSPMISMDHMGAI